MNARQGLQLSRLWYLVGATLLLLVCVLSLIPPPQIDVAGGDKFSHLLAYLLLAGWFSLLVRRPRSLLWVILGISAYGIFIEGLQSLTAYRYAEWGDVLANSLGAVIGILCYFTPLTRILRLIDARLARFLL